MRVRRNWLVRTILFPCLFPFTLPFLSHSLQRAVAIRRNPFYYRSSFKLTRKPTKKRGDTSQSLLLQVFVQISTDKIPLIIAVVAIPSITGLRSNVRGTGILRSGAMSQSLLLQVFVQILEKKKVVQEMQSQSLLLQVFVQIGTPIREN